MNMPHYKINKPQLFLILFSLFLIGGSTAALASPNAHKATGHGAHHQACNEVALRCAKTVTTTLSNTGRIWFAWVVGKHLYVNFSDDRGSSFSTPTRVTAIPAKIAARGENRPKIATDKQGNLYLSWVKKLSKKWTSDILFSWSTDNGASFSTPLKINNDSIPTGHSFNEMEVNDQGVVSIAWLDGRHGLEATKQGKKPAGTSIYFTQFTPSNKALNKEVPSAPPNIRQRDNSCVCCRLALTLSEKDVPLLMWRHIFGDNYRDHALATLSTQSQATTLHRVSFENWQINGCPHHGPSITNQAGRIHMSWFNDAPDASGLFYGYTDNEGQSVSPAIQIAQKKQSPSHPHIITTHSGSVRMVWQEFDGTKHTVMMTHSKKGEQWATSIEIAQSGKKTDYPFLLPHPQGDLLVWHKPGQPLTLIEVE